MRIIGVALLFLGALYPMKSYFKAIGERNKMYASLVSVMTRINDKILDTGPDLYEIFRDYDGDLRSEMLECSRLSAPGRRSIISSVVACLGDDGEAFCFYISAFGKAPGAEEKKKLSCLLERIASKADDARSKAKERERAVSVLYISALASALLLAL